MRRTVYNLVIWAVVAALVTAPRINMGPFVNRGWIVPPHLVLTL